MITKTETEIREYFDLKDHMISKQDFKKSIKIIGIPIFTKRINYNATTKDNINSVGYQNKSK